MNTKNIYAHFFWLLSKFPNLSKEDLVWKYSNMLTDSLSEFHERDLQGYAKMISDLQQIANSMIESKKQPQKLAKKTTSIITKNLRSAILTRLQKYGVDTTDWDKVNSFMERPQIAGKRLYEMTDAEMSNIISKMESILKKDKLKKDETERMVLMN